MRKRALMFWPMLAGGMLVFVLIAILLGVVASLYANRAPLFDPPGPGVRLGLYLRTNVAQTSAFPVLPELAPLRLTANTEMALNAILQIGDELGWQAITVDESRTEVRAVIVSAVFRFTDDIHVRLLERGTQGSEAAVRSSSRVGRGDFGANAHHIMALRDALSRRALLAEDGR